MFKTTTINLALIDVVKSDELQVDYDGGSREESKDVILVHGWEMYR